MEFFNPKPDGIDQRFPNFFSSGDHFH